MSVCVYMCICLYACMLASNLCLYMTIITFVISKASHAIDTRWRFLCWLTALRVNNNMFNTFKPLPNIFLYFSLTEDKYAKFIFILNSLKLHLNESFSQIISPS